jgi:allophanate hydrolase subunit 2
MGYRLAGPKIARKGSTPFVSDGTVMGALQVPSDGQPILLMADRQPTGGYPIVAVVITADLHFAAQIAPGDKIGFVLSTLADAQALLRQRRAQLDAMLPPWSDPSHLLDHTTLPTT